MSSFGSPQKYSGLSPGTFHSSLIVTWSPPIHEGVADTETALSAARKSVVSCMTRLYILIAVAVCDCGEWRRVGGVGGRSVETCLPPR